MRLPLLKNSSGQESASFSMMIVGFAVVTLWLLLSITESLFGFQIREFSAGEAMSYLTPLCVLYFGRRWIDTNGPSEDEDLDLIVDESEMGAPGAKRSRKQKIS